jgi:ribulose-phosphate 3-epimerase
VGVQISPSILAADFADLAGEVARIATTADWVHVDVMDNHFVPNLTLGLPVVERLVAVSALPLDVHLMIVEPERYIETFVRAGADLVTVHVEACPHLDRTLHQIREAGAKAGVALNPSTPPQGIEWVLDSLDLVLVMSVNPGFGGQSFIPSSLAKVRQIRTLVGNRPIEVSVDGGVNHATAASLAQAGATTLVAGSAVFGSHDPGQAVKDLRSASEVLK